MDGDWNAHVAHLRQVFLGLGYDEEDAALSAVKAHAVAVVQGALKERGWTQIELARRCDMRQPHISAFLSGRTEEFSIERVNRILAVFGWEIGVRHEYAFHTVADRSAA